ncbi:dethiobiotin synthase [Stieleria sp. TO1_6]|nr:dethiobiotin synthase [Stieleria tagensis]
MKVIFVTGTGTEVGKTYVASMLAARELRAGIRVGVYKPVASGCIRGESSGQVNFVDSPPPLVSNDAELLWRAAGKPLDLDAVCPQRFQAALAPDEAARREGKTVDRALLLSGLQRWRGHCETLIVEGAGGLFSPLAEGFLNLDLFLQLDDAELVLVAANRLGVIHDVIATCRAAELQAAGVSRLVLTAAGPKGDESSSSNAAQLKSLCPGLDISELAWQS